MPTSLSKSKSKATRCSALRPCRPNAVRSPRTSCNCLSGITRARALPLSECRTIPVWHGWVLPNSSATLPLSYKASITFPPTVASTIPVQPLVSASSARYSSDLTPTEEALTRSGRSLVTRTTSLDSAIMFLAIERILESFEPSRKKPDGRDDESEWFSSTRRVPPSLFNLISSSSRPCSIRRSSRVRRAARAK